MKLLAWGSSFKAFVFAGIVSSTYHINRNTWTAKFFVDSDPRSFVDQISKQTTTIKGKRCSTFLVYNLTSDGINEHI